MFNKRLSQKTIIFLTMSALVLPSFCFSQYSSIGEIPETFGEAKEMMIMFLNQIFAKLPATVKRIWQDEAMPVFRKMKQVWSGIWENYLQPWLEIIWERVLSLLGKEVGKRSPQIEQELEKEKEELREELPEIKKSLWERLKELLR